MSQPPRFATSSFATSILAQAVGALETAVRALDGSPAALRSAHERFAAARRFYKRAEYIAAYYNPTTADLMNGPALPRVEEDEGPDVVFPPEGFQVIEEQLFPVADVAARDTIANEVQNLAELVTRLRTATRGTPLTDVRVFDAMRVGIARILSLGLSGFDSPVALRSVPEAAQALRGVRDGFDAYSTAFARLDPDCGRSDRQRVRDDDLGAREESRFRRVRPARIHHRACEPALASPSGGADDARHSKCSATCARYGPVRARCSIGTRSIRSGLRRRMLDVTHPPRQR